MQQVNISALLDEKTLEVGRKAIEDTLISLRDERIGLLNRNNGCVVKERDGTASSVIRLAPEDALRVGIQAMAKHLFFTK